MGGEENAGRQRPQPVAGRQSAKFAAMAQPGQRQQDQCRQPQAVGGDGQGGGVGLGVADEDRGGGDGDDGQAQGKARRKRLFEGHIHFSGLPALRAKAGRHLLVKPRDKMPNPARATAKTAPLKTGEITLATSSAARTRQTPRNVNPAVFLFIFPPGYPIMNEVMVSEPATGLSLK